jgi:hypothetical protein
MPRAALAPFLDSIGPLLILCAVATLAAPVSAGPFQGGESVNGFPNWGERVIHEWINRARCDPQIEMAQCGSNCSEGYCYSPKPPLPWSLPLNKAARFHCDEMQLQSFFGHDSHCTLVANIGSLYPDSCSGVASCACIGGTSMCNAICTTWNQRVALFGASPMGESIANGPASPDALFYLWLYQNNLGMTNCSWNNNNANRWNMLMLDGSVGAGFTGTLATIDYGVGGTIPKIPSGSHYPRQASSVDVWANWYDASAPSEALVNVDGTCHPLTLLRGTPQNGAWSATISGVGTGCHRYYFVFRDAAGTITTYPGTGSLGIGPTGCADWDTSRPLTARPICPGDGSAGACPCGNSGASGHGCANSQVAAGALSSATGTTFPDTVVLTSSGELPVALSIFLQGSARLSPSVFFGDGLRCAGGTLKRIGTKSASGGVAVYPGVGDPSISARSAALGDPIPAGASRYYLTYYRDPNPAFCPNPPGNTWNATGGLELVW